MKKPKPFLFLLFFYAVTYAPSTRSSENNGAAIAHNDLDELPSSIADAPDSRAGLINTDAGIVLAANNLTTINGGSNMTVQGYGTKVILNVASNPTFTGAMTLNNGLTITSGGISVTGAATLSSLAAGVLIASATGALSSNATTANAVQIGNASGTLSSLGVGTNGQLLMGSTSAAPAFSTVTSTSGTITSTLGAHSLDLETTAGTFGNVVRVDKTGSNSTGVRNGLPFLTISAALAVAQAGDVVWIFPGTYNESITIPASVSVMGLSEGAGAGGSPTGGVIISQTGVSATTDLVTMGENSSLANVSLNLTSASNVAIRGIVFPGTTSSTARVRGVSINVSSSYTGTGTNYVYGINSTGTGTPSSDVSSIADSSMMVSAAGSQPVRGIEVGGTSTFNISNCAITVNNTATGGSALGVETQTGTTCNINSSSISGTSATATSGADISQSAGTIVLSNTKLVILNANSLGFTAFTSPPMLTWMLTGAFGAGITRYLYIGTNPATATESLTYITAPQPLVIKSLM